MKARTRKLVDFKELEQIRDKHRQQKIVHCHGVFDVLHAGHLAYFESAKKLGDILIVTLTADKYVNKGPGRPYFNGSVRANMVAALETVDYVSISDYPTAVPAIESLKPDLYVKGPDYRNMARDSTGAIYLEEKAVIHSGGQLTFTTDETESSSALINKFFSSWNDEQTNAIDAVKKEGGIEKVEEVLERISREDVVVIGEPIVDTYVFCRPEAISSKSPCLSAKYLFEEDYAGGSLAIANHLCDFAKSVTLLTTHGSEPYFQDVLKEKLDQRVHMIGYEIKNKPTPRKIRYIADDKVQRLLEITHLQSDQWVNNPPDEFCKLILDTARPGMCTLIADFGHGLFEKQVLSTVGDIDSFICLNVQTNSSNFGFNPFTKHRKFSYLSIDLKEARVAFQDRHSDHIDLVKRIFSGYAAKNQASVSVTLGQYGSLFLPHNSHSEIKVPAFADNVVDAVGAGDAFFAITSLLAKVNCPETMMPFLGNVFAGLKTKIMGNKASVSRAQLLKAVSAILK